MQEKLDKKMAKEKDQALGVEERLMAKFRLRDIEWVIVSATDFKYQDGNIGIKARATPYIKKESAERRADEVLGAFNWRNAFSTPDDRGRFTYKIEIRHPEHHGEWVPKIGGGSIDLNASGQFESNAFEIALSFAEKRVWSKIGIGRYLKLIPQMEVDVSEDWMDGWGYYSFKSKVEGTKQNPVWRKFYWRPPILDDDLLHEDDRGKQQSAKPKSTAVSSKEKSSDPPPPKKNPPKEALKVQWNTIEAYYKALPDPEKDKWTNVLYKEDVEEGTGVIVATHRKTLTMEFAQKIIDSMKKGYGELDENEWPEKIEKPKKT